MKLKTFTLALLCCGAGFLNGSCEKEEELLSLANTHEKAAVQQNSHKASGLEMPNARDGVTFLLRQKLECSLKHQLAPRLADEAVEPSECGPTELDEAIAPYVDEFGPLEWEWYSLLSTINQLYTFLDESPQYFGADGQLTQYAAKHKRNLESFWQMPDEITLKGQHTATLQDREAIAAVYMNFAGVPAEIAYDYADFLLENVIGPSEVFDTTPLLSLDGFATTGDLIVIGDGIVQILAEAGGDEKVVFAGILAHEWAHQLQFNNYLEWYGVAREDQVNTPESTRLTELEADFLTGYYLTHKRGGTYNWKRTEDFLELFFNIGDCAFTSTGHHGTPIQRMAAARLGYELARDTFPKGKILEADELHAIFMDSFPDIIGTSNGNLRAHLSSHRQ